MRSVDPTELNYVAADHRIDRLRRDASVAGNIARRRGHDVRAARQRSRGEAPGAACIGDRRAEDGRAVEQLDGAAGFARCR